MRNIILLMGLLFFISAYSQKVDYDSAEQLVNDLKGRNYEKSIAFMEHQLDSIEKNSKDVFPDSIYVGIVTLLTGAYIQTDNIYEADTLLNHSINYMIRTGRKSSLAYELFVAYGGLQVQLQNFKIAAIYLKSAADILASQNDKGENYSVILSMLATCHLNMDSLYLAKQEIDESIYIIERASSRFSLSNKMGIYQKAGAIYHKLGRLEKAEEFTKLAYELSKDDDIYVSEFVNAANNLSILYLNKGDYLTALKILHEMERKPLSKIEKTNVYNNIFLANYFLNNEDETVKYAELCSNSLKISFSDLYASLPTMTLENFGEKSIMQLKVNMGILDKFANNQLAVEMCYNNAIFAKNIVFSNIARLREEASKDNEIKSLLMETQRLKSEIFAGNSSAYKELSVKERVLVDVLKAKSNDNMVINMPVWTDIKNALDNHECAIEFITYVGFKNSEEETKELKYAALIVSPEIEHIKFVELCTFSQLHGIILNALKEQEIGINSLYVKGNEILYKLLWEKIEPHIINAKTIYVSPTLDIQDINIGFIPCQNNFYVNNKYDIRILTSTAELCNKRKLEITKAAIWGGIEYSKEKKSSNTYRGIVLNGLNETSRGGFGILRASSMEADSVRYILETHNIPSSLFKGTEATEKSLREMAGNSPSILHFSTHGFYLVGFDKYLDYFGQLLPVTRQDLSMIFSGFLLAGANVALNDSNKKQPLNDGVITAEEISMMDFSNTDLVILSACETGIGTHSEGYGGLIRAFKMAGAKQILASLWKVQDEATSMLMIDFYHNLTNGDEIHKALHKAQFKLSRKFPDPFYWASFIILD